jgi:hypothetical protein
MFVGEKLSTWQVGGMALVLSQSVMIQLPDRSSANRNATTELPS